MHPPAALHRNVQQENKASEREREREALESFPKRRVEDNLLGFRHVRIAQSIKSISTYARASRAQNHRALPKSIECYIYTLYRKYERERERGFEMKSSHVSNGSLAIYRSIAYWPRPRCIIASCACLDQVFQLSLVVQQQRLLIWAGTLRLSREKLNKKIFSFCCLLIRFKRTLQVEEKDVTVYHLALVYLQMRKRSRQIGWHERESRPWWSRNNSGALCQLYTLCLWLSLSGLCLSVCAELIISGRSSGRDRRANWWRGKNPVSRCRRPMLKTSDLC